ncbi:MAG: ribosome maturation factor RimM [Oscillospiraceae bacterium]|jgi:16S rRNA processing protein RimM|nr:ribosome maturation factor RimM [Oscillospiraceae bacterium]
MNQEHLEAGKIVSTHGVRGELKILPWADSAEFLLRFSTYYIGGEPYAVESSRVHKTCVLAKLAGVDSVEAAVLLREKTVCIDRSNVRLPDGRVFIADLIGCRVFDETNAEIGTIQDVLTLPAGDVYIVKGQREYMIPAVKEFVREIDTAQRTVRVHLIEGMASDEN